MVESINKGKKESEEKYRHLFESSPYAILLLTHEGVIVDGNSMVGKNSGITKDMLIGKNIFELPLIPSKYKSIVTENFNRVIGGDTQEPIEIQILDKNNELIWEHIESSVFELDGQTIIQLIINNITKEKRAEQKLKESEEKFRTISEESLLGILIMQDDKVKYLNQQLADMWGYKKEEMKRMTLTEQLNKLVYEEYRDFIRDQFYKKQRGIEDVVNNYIFKAYHKTGAMIWFDCLAKTIFYEDRPADMVSFIDITEQVEAKENLKASEERYKSLFESSMIGIITTNQEGTITNVNPATASILGYDSVEDMIGLPAAIIYIDPNQREPFIQRIKKLGYLEDFEVQLKKKDGKYIDTMVNAIVHKDREGKFLKGEMFFKDITKRKKAEKEISSLARFPSENPNPVLRATKEKVIYLNEAGEKLFNIMEGESVPLVMLNTVNEVFSLNEIKRLEIEHGKHIYSYVITPVEAEDYVNIYGSDITEFKKAEEKIKESEEKFRTFAEQSFMGISILQDNLFKYVNSKLAELFGFTSDELLNLQQGDFIKLVHPEDRALVSEQVRKRQLGDLEVINNYQFRGIRKNGDIIWLDVFGKTINYEGRPASYATLMDITEKKNIEEIKSKLLTRFSHEFKTPLVSINGYIDLLLNEYKKKFDNETISILREAKEGSKRLNYLVNLYIKSSELGEKLVKLDLTEDNLVPLINSCLNELKGLIRLRSHNITLDLKEDLITKFDREKTKEVISNLLVNSIKFTPAGGNILIKTSINDNFIIFSIKDNGIGMTEKEKLQIFKRFGKIERYRQGWDILSEGSGMGLYISKELVELQGGNMWVESEGRNQGCTFYFSLPLLK